MAGAAPGPAGRPGFADFLAYLEAERLLTPESLQRARHAYASTAHPADTVLIELGLLREADLAGHLAGFLGLPDDRGPLPERIDPALIEAAGRGFVEARQVLPLAVTAEALTVAVADPFDHAVLDVLGYQFDRPVDLRVVPRSAIRARIRGLDRDPAAGPAAPDPAAGPEAGPDAGRSEDLERLQDVAREAPIIRFVAQTIQEAVDRGATDIHVEPQSDQVVIRFRRDGLLARFDSVPRAMQAGIATRIKILARLNIAEHRMPQDGRMRVAVRGQEIDLRVSVLPSVHGESFVLRVLDRSGVTLSLDSLGYAPDAIARLRDLSRTPNGIILVTGPTGSGKTTTLYSVLRERQSEDVKIFTVEDPVEYRLDGITQLQVDPAIDLGFSRALRSVLRHDPDIILVGEIRDRETAQIAIQAALTGHLVFSTLHTNSATGALTRLLDMGVDGYLIGATIRFVVAQRLVRRLCSACGGPREGCTTGAAEGRAGGDPGCPACHGTGFSGRTVTYEIVEVTRDLARRIAAGAAEAELADTLAAQGHRSMAAHATGLVRAGVTTRAEMRRVLEAGPEAADDPAG